MLSYINNILNKKLQLGLKYCHEATWHFRRNLAPDLAAYSH